ncbi:MAG: lysophospholipid acyltransferase family protein [Acidobacteria bacterium]|nr:lysophospholipid acyltransferase family protein [Acidobacteriota bacterium]
MSKRSTLRNWVEFLPAYLLLKALGLLPRRTAISVSQFIARLIFKIHKRLRQTGYRNLELALPEVALQEREKILLGVFDNLGRMLGEFSQFLKISRDNIGEVVRYEGFEHYAQAKAKGKGVLMLTGHLGAWELCAFAHGVYGHPLRFLARPLDNPLLETLINRYRALSQNLPIDKNNSVREVLKTLRSGNDVGLLIDANTLANEGVFCDFFGIPACSTTGLAVFALRADAPVVPGFLIWDEGLHQHVLHFAPEIPLIRTGDFKEEVALNTARFTQVIEEWVRRHPPQWLWIHRRWRTRPAGEPDLYAHPPTRSTTPTPAKLNMEV